MKLYFKYFSIHFRSTMEYKMSFFLSCLGQFLVSFTAFLAVFFMFQRFHQVKGFRFEEVVLCYAVVLLSFSLAECFFRGFDAFPSMIKNGEFDRVLVRPRNEIFQVLCSKLSLSRISRTLQGVVMMVYAIRAGDILWTWDKILTLCFMVVGGIVMFGALFLLYAGFCFFTIEGLEFMNIFTDGAREHGRYPFGVYGDRILRLVTYVVPLACFQYYPLLYLIGKEDNWLLALTPLACFLFWIPCWLFWRFGIHKYKSTGS